MAVLRLIAVRMAFASDTSAPANVEGAGTSPCARAGSRAGARAGCAHAGARAGCARA